ncbi:Uncharacterised protein [Mycobacterium tuberculosis]|nr:Uncharacterised protein [Mycobacterium tuberculosis]
MTEALCDKLVGAWDLVSYVERAAALALGHLAYGGR